MRSSLRRLNKKDFSSMHLQIEYTRDAFNTQSIFSMVVYAFLTTRELFSSGLFHCQNLRLGFQELIQRTFWRLPSYDKAASILALINQLLSYPDRSFHRFNVFKEKASLIYAQTEIKKRFLQLCFKIPPYQTTFCSLVLLHVLRRADSSQLYSFQHL